MKNGLSDTDLAVIVAEARLPLVKILTRILEVNDDFRETVGEHFDGDPLSDECDRAREELKLLGVVA